MKALVGLGVQQTLLCRSGDDLVRLAQESGISVRTWRPLAAAVPMLSPGFVRIVKELSPDIIHTRLLSAAGIAGAWRSHLGIPVVATFDKPGKAKYYKNIDQYISCAHWLKQYMSEHEGLPAEKIDVVHNPADTERFAGSESNRKAARALLNIVDNEVLVSGMGIFIHRKGFDVLLRAFARLCPERKKLRLALIGGGGDQREAYLKLADELGIRDKLLIPERFVEDVRPWLWASDIFVMPSREEGFSIALLEALASGLPTVVSDIAPFTEIIQDGENGLIAKKNDPEDFARGLQRMLDMNTAQRNQLVQQAQKTIRNFTPEAIARQTLAVYEKVLRQEGKA
jgi:glycosyltransferase involved in cell wall biosynthesis